MSVEGMRLYLIIEDKKFKELDDEEITDNYNIDDDDNLFVLSYRWGFTSDLVIITKNGKKIQGIEVGDTGLAIKLRVQDQFGIPVSDLKLFQLKNNSYEVKDYLCGISLGAQAIGFPDDHVVFYDTKYATQRVYVAITMEELQTEQRRATLETAAAEVGLTVEEHQADQVRRKEEA